MCRGAPSASILLPSLNGLHVPAFASAQTCLGMSSDLVSDRSRVQDNNCDGGTVWECVAVEITPRQ